VLELTRSEAGHKRVSVTVDVDPIALL
jgi:hypothetical protein